MVIPKTLAAMLTMFVLQALPARAQGLDPDRAQEEPPTAEEMAQLKPKSLALLRDIMPDPKKHPPMKEMNVIDGRVTWGHLFSDDEVTALVSVGTRQDYEIVHWQEPPNFLSLLYWKEDHWEYRQYVGELDAFEITCRKGVPACIVQGSNQTGRYEALQHSWRYDPKSRGLISTGWDQWGPFYMVGDYICYKRGRERIGHDDSRTIYRFKDGKVGERIAQWHENDRGESDVTFHDPQYGKSMVWTFYNKIEDETHYSVSVTAEKDGPNAEGKKAVVEMKDDQFPGGQHFFELLTGLNEKILDGEWLDELPTKPLKRWPMKVTGAPEIVQRLQWPKEKSKPAR